MAPDEWVTVSGTLLSFSGCSSFFFPLLSKPWNQPVGRPPQKKCRTFVFLHRSRCFTADSLINLANDGAADLMTAYITKRSVAPRCADYPSSRRGTETLRRRHDGTAWVMKETPADMRRRISMDGRRAETFSEEEEEEGQWGHEAPTHRLKVAEGLMHLCKLLKTHPGFYIRGSI